MRIQKRVEKKRFEIEAYNQTLKLNLPVFLLERAIYKPVTMLEQVVVVVVFCFVFVFCCFYVFLCCCFFVTDSCWIASTPGFFSPGMCMTCSNATDTKQVKQVKVTV